MLQATAYFYKVSIVLIANNLLNTYQDEYWLLSEMGDISFQSKDV